MLLAATINVGAVVPSAVQASPADVQVLSVPDGGDAGDAAAASSPAISGNGRYVAFESAAHLDPGVAERPGSVNIYVRDRQSPGRTVLISRALPQTSRVAPRGRSVPLRGTALREEEGNDDSLHPSISADGRYVAFDSAANNLRDGYWPAGRRVLVCDRDPDGDGVFDELRPDELMDYGYVYVGVMPLEGRPPPGAEPSLSADAGTIAWSETAEDAQAADVVIAKLGKDDTGRPFPPDPDLFVRPLQNLPEALGTREGPEVSADGQYVVFSALLPRPTPVPAGPLSTVQVFDLTSSTTERLDAGTDGEFSGRGSHPVISDGGRVVAFEQAPTGLGPVVTVVVDRDPDADGTLGPAGGAPTATSIASATATGEPAEGRAPALSADGRYLAFESSAAGLHGDVGDTGRTAVVLRDLTLDAERAKSALPRLAGELGSPAAAADCAVPPASISDADELACPSKGPSRMPRLSADGAVLSFTSDGDDLLPDPCCAGAVFARAFRPGLRGDAADFGSVALGNSVSRTVVLRQSGFGPLRLGGVRLTGTDAQDFALSGAENCAGAVLHQTGTCEVAVVFTPGASGHREARLRIELPEGGVAETQLVAEGSEVPPTPPPTTPSTRPPAEPPLPPPAAPSGGLVVTPEPVLFGGTEPVLVARAPRPVTVRNASTTSITITAVAVLEGPRFTTGDFSVAGTTCAGTVLAPGDTCSIQLRTTPQGAGRRDGVLGIETTDATYRRLVALRSEARQPTLVASPAVVRPNRVVTVTGRDFPPGRAISIAFATPGSRTQVTVLTKPDGTFSLQMLVFPQTSAGTWPVVASVTGTTVRAQTPLLVVPGSYQPPGFTSRR
ncbi:choice-of-anchor D domain-containing protein [Kribbella sp. DT2]|uniref:choice-of-anchor D domain-containing protein n=1 Tax=Kribbella sp. DT2 TaxID=3393427 RepID=UPI003CF505A6